MFSIAEVQPKVINCYSAIKSCLLQVMHTKAIAALTQFFDFSQENFKPENKGGNRLGRRGALKKVIY